MNAAAPVTLTEFARIAGYKVSYISQLKRDGRLVLSEDGRRVRVNESLARIEATRSPNHAPVAERHAEARAQVHSAPSASIAAPAPDHIGETFAASRAVRARFDALTAKLEYERESGKLIEIAAARLAVSGAARICRARLEALPDVLAAQIAATHTESEVRVLLAEGIEQALSELSRALAEYGRAQVAA